MLDEIVNKINKKADDFETIRKIALDIVCEINENSKYSLELIVSKPNLLIEIKDLCITIKLFPDQVKGYAANNGITIKEQIIRNINGSL